jgi:CRP-like cAMP-binding protein
MDLFKNFMRLHTDLTDSDIELMSNLARVREINRNEYLLTAGEVCRQKAFVISGILRTFIIAADGSEQTLRFSAENSWVTDQESYDLQTAANSNIFAVEPCILLLWSKTDLDILEATLPTLKDFTTQVTQQHIYHSDQPLSPPLGATPEARYKEFVNKYPVLQLRLPQRMIAAYLGITIRTLERIRQEQQ